MAQLCISGMQSPPEEPPPLLSWAAWPVPTVVSGPVTPVARIS